MNLNGLHINSTLYLLTERLEAKYFYLPHGPLARVELGKKSIQGLDYAYTLQGWLKDINGYRNDISSTNVYDIGKDGSATNFTNKRFGKDGFATMLQYYTGDYNPISGNNYYNLGSPNSVGLYNGNISAISLGIKDLDPLLKSFRYDKLNRIKMMESASLSNNIWGVLSNRFGTEYSYDFNGNITNLSRRDQTATLLHDISYTYEHNRNRLRGIEVNGTEIISSSYHYDALGNLIEDDAEGIEVDWNVIGKVRNVLTPNNRLNFAYNPFGQRQIKRTDNDSTYYVHDATGNVMGIYIKEDLTLTAKERPIYGSARLGIMNKAVVFNMTGGLVSKSNSTIGIKEYELSDHLGNVSVVVLDRKNYDGTNFFPYFKSMSDYYPFGYPISTRTFSIEPYRYGFNGQEGDNEVYGDGKSYTAEYWQYDSRLGRRWNVDPKPNISLSSYSCFANNPIIFSDIKGDSAIVKLSRSLRKELGISRKEAKNYTPEKIAQVFKQEYGMNVEVRNGWLHYTGESKTQPKTYSQTAKKMWIKELSDNYQSKEVLILTNKGTNYNVGNKKSYINLSLFDDQLNFISIESGYVNIYYPSTDKIF